MDHTVQKLREKLSAFLEKSNPKYSRLALFGAGNTYQLYKKSIAMEALFFEYFLDNNPAKYGAGCMDGKAVYSMRECAEKGLLRSDTLVLIVSNGKARAEIQAQLNEAGVRSMPIDSFVLHLHKEEVMQVFDSLHDNFSKQTYAHVLLTRAGEEEQMPAEIYCPDAYYALPPFLRIAEDDVFVDLGAYVGDTIENYIWKSLGTFGRIYAFEPEKRNVAALESRVKRLNREWALDDDKIKIIPAGIGRKNGAIHMNGTSAGSPSLSARLDTQSDAGEMINMFSIDEFFRGKPEHITAIKADIESFEYDMLLGAEQTIKENHPRLAICVYHGISDLYRIPLLIKEYCPDYRLEIRHHSMTLAETVLYVYPMNTQSWIKDFQERP